MRRAGAGEIDPAARMLRRMTCAPHRPTHTVNG